MKNQAKQKCNIETELNKIRVDLYNKEKQLSNNDWEKQVKEKTELYAKKYNLPIFYVQ